jgi:hypothetical protein
MDWMKGSTADYVGFQETLSKRVPHELFRVWPDFSKCGDLSPL